MIQYVALLRAVNVGGTGKLLMADLRNICQDAGLIDAQTYIASGNIVFKSEATAVQVKVRLKNHLLSHQGQPVGVIIRTASEMRDILEKNPFPKAEPKYTSVIFLDECPPSDALLQATGLGDEEMCLGGREIYIYYGKGMGRSKLKIPVAKNGTARNINTVTKLAEMASGL